MKATIAAVLVTLLHMSGVTVMPCLAADTDVAQPAKQKPTDANVEQEPAPDDSAPTADAPRYQPPRRGAPKVRVGGGTRGDSDLGSYLAVVTPPHTGVTARPQPELHWFISRPPSARLEFTLINETDIEPMIEATLDGRLEPGIQALRLSDYGVTLQPERRYQWSVALVEDARQRSGDRLASGMLRYVPLEDDLAARLRTATAETAVRLYARAGYWYDAFAVLSHLISARPGDVRLVRERTALLEQAELPEISAFERRRIEGAGAD